MSEKVVTKITDEELKQVQEVRQKWNKLTFDLGSLSYREIQVEKAIQELKYERDTLLKQMNEIQALDEELLRQIESKYGEGDLNIITGEFSTHNS